MVIAWLFLPDLPAIVIGGILIYIPGVWLNDRVKSRRQNIDQLLPIAIGRTPAGLLAGGAVPDVLQQVGESLEMEKTNPLTPESILTASEMRIKDKVEALRRVLSRSPMVSLAKLDQLLEGYTEASGRSFTGEARISFNLEFWYPGKSISDRVWYVRDAPSILSKAKFPTDLHESIYIQFLLTFWNHEENSGCQ